IKVEGHSASKPGIEAARYKCQASIRGEQIIRQLNAVRLVAALACVLDDDGVRDDVASVDTVDAFVVEVITVIAGCDLCSLVIVAVGGRFKLKVMLDRA